MAVPWGTIIAALPGLIATANRFVSKTEQQTARGSGPPPATPEKALADAIRRIEVLESLEPEQTRLLKDSMEQLQNVALLSSATAMRANLALGLSVVAAVLATVAVLN